MSQHLISQYKNWLITLNYSKSTQKRNPSYLQEFFVWSSIKEVQEITSEKIVDWFDYLSKRKNKTRAGALSLNTLKNYYGSLSSFHRFLRETGKEIFPLPKEVFTNYASIHQPVVLTQQEIKQLYQATENYADPTIEDKGILAARERVLLGLYYGCGLRRVEATSLLMRDVNLQKNLIHVRKGKNYKERYVPITSKVKLDLEYYLNHSRPFLLRGNQSNHLLLGWQSARPMSKENACVRIKVLRELTGINKDFGVHSLRHSIATHLLQNGMKLEQIAKFLGHSSLESTTIYTHIANEKEIRIQ